MGRMLSNDSKDLEKLSHFSAFGSIANGTDSIENTTKFLRNSR